MASIPRLGIAARQKRLTEIPGLVPDLRKPVIGCAFAPRCTLADDRCRAEAPPLADHGEGHLAACWKPEVVA
jgi:peptide/nickel transport system ATP-binding protein